MPSQFDEDGTSSDCSGILFLIRRVGNLCKRFLHALLTLWFELEFVVVHVDLFEILKRIEKILVILLRKRFDLALILVFSQRLCFKKIICLYEVLISLRTKL